MALNARWDYLAVASFVFSYLMPFRHTVNYEKLQHRKLFGMRPKDARGMANNVSPDQTAFCDLILLCMPPAPCIAQRIKRWSVDLAVPGSIHA